MPSNTQHNRQYITHGYYAKNHKIRPSGLRQYIQDYKIKMEFKEIVSEGVDWINLAQDKG
jgi:hypothetical protein